MLILAYFFFAAAALLWWLSGSVLVATAGTLGVGFLALIGDKPPVGLLLLCALACWAPYAWRRVS